MVTFSLEKIDGYRPNDWIDLPNVVSHIKRQSLRLKEASHIDFVHKKRHMDVGERGGGGG